MRTGRRLRALTAVAVIVGALAVAAPSGATSHPEVRSVATVVTVSGNTAKVIGVYRCFGGTPIHLWVSVKQGGPDPTAEGSGGTSKAWYDTNIAGAPAVNCDGRYHTVTVPVAKYPDKQQLREGRAWVQFCLVSDQGIVASISQWVRVVKA